MKNFAKLTTDNQLHYATNPIKIVISNPTEEQLKYFGYKEVIDTTPPIHNTETHYAVPHYEEQLDMIVQKWEIKEIPQSEESFEGDINAD